MGWVPVDDPSTAGLRLSVHSTSALPWAVLAPSQGLTQTQLLLPGLPGFAALSRARATSWRAPVVVWGIQEWEMQLRQSFPSLWRHSGCGGLGVSHPGFSFSLCSRKGFPGLEQGLLASERGIPCPCVPSCPGPAGLPPGPALCFPPGISRNHRVPWGCRGCAWTQICVIAWIFIHTHLDLVRSLGRGAETQGAGFLSPGSRPRAARPGSRGMVLECSVQWLCLPGHPSGHLVIPLCQLLHTGMGGKGVLGTVRAVLIPLASPGQSLDRGTPVLGGCGKNGTGSLGMGEPPGVGVSPSLSHRVPFPVSQLLWAPLGAE